MKGSLTLSPGQAQRLRKVLEWTAAQTNERGVPLGVASEASELLPDLFTVREVSLPRPRPSSSVPRGESRTAQHKRIVADVRERDGGRCCARGWNGACRGMLHLDHFYGRAKAEEAVETLWLLCARHHELKTANRPGRVAWLELYRIHCTRHGYAGELARLERLVALEVAQHPHATEVAGG